MSYKDWLGYFFPSGQESRLSTRPIVFGFLLTTVAFIFFVLNLAHRPTPILSFLAVAGASFAFGSLMGFLFGIPKVSQLGKDRTTGLNGDNYYSDNKNIEEISDWLTKIIVGLSLVKIRSILGYLGGAASFFGDAVSASLAPTVGYVVGYGIIVIYMIYGGGLSFIWTRINFPLILTSSKMQQLQIERYKEIAEKERLEKENLEQSKISEELRKHLTRVEEAYKGIYESIQEKGSSQVLSKLVSTFSNEGDYPSDAFVVEIESIYKERPIKFKDDIQKHRWGRQVESNGLTITASYEKALDIYGHYGVKVEVKRIDSSQSFDDEVAFFMHDSFPREILYEKAYNGLAFIDFVAYEAFVIGARTQSGIELELDLNSVAGFPKNFYY